MTAPQSDLSQKSERTLRLALLLSAPGPLVTGIAALTSLSTTQIADFVRRTAELVATFMSWWIFRKVARLEVPDEALRARMEKIANRTVSLAMLCSGLTLFAIGVLRLFAKRAGGASILGLVIAVLGLITNAWFFFRYRSLGRKRPDPVIAAQKLLYRAKAFVDVCVVAALLMVAVLPGHPVTQYVDALGSLVVAAYLIFSCAQMVRSERAPAA